MSNKIKNIPFSTLVRKAESLFPNRRKEDIRIFDVPSDWMPVPHDIQISLSQLNHAKRDKEISAFHQKFVLKIHLRGTSRGYVEQELYTFKPGEGILVFPFQFHRIVKTQKNSGQFRLLANFTLSQQDRNALEPLRNRLIRFSAEDLALITRMLQSAPGADPQDQREVVFALSSLLVSLLKKVSETAQEKRLFSPQIRTAFDYIYLHYRERLTIKEIAFSLGYSETGFRKLFFHETGQTPGHLIRELRLNDAAAKLRSTNLPIEKISRESGFSNPYSFSRAFRTRFKISPREFRKS